MATDVMGEKFDQEIQPAEDMSFVELVEELDAEGITKADLDAIDTLLEDYTGLNIEIKQGPQSASWDEETKQAALEAVGGGDADSASMSDKIMSLPVPCIKAMGSARSALNRLKTDIFYTVPYPGPGAQRRVRVGKLDKFKELVEAHKTQIRECAEEMNRNREAIKAAAKKKFKSRYNDKHYDSDFTVLYTVHDSYPPLTPNPALHQFKRMRDEESQRLRRESAQSLVLFKRTIAETFQEMIDSAASRLEGRRILDGKHEVLTVEKREGGNVVVNYRDSSVKRGKKPERQITMMEAELDARVKIDNKRKNWQDETMQRLVTETKRLQEAMNQIGVGGEDLKPIFKRLENILRGQTEENINKNLKNSDAYRDSLHQSLVGINNALLDTAVLKPKRDVVRRRSKTAAINPELV